MEGLGNGLVRKVPANKPENLSLQEMIHRHKHRGSQQEGYLGWLASH